MAVAVALTLTGPDHRLAPGPVTRETGIERKVQFEKQRSCPQPTGATERPSAPEGSPSVPF
ncbi:hypothetical protein J3F83DRAFT_717624 [Trichoderma novae-zelandiae]